MPKKSNKTAHVLSLLTNGGGEFPEDIHMPKADLEQNAVLETSKKEVVVELQGSVQSDLLSDLVKLDLQKELDKQLTKKKKETTLQEEDVSVNDRPPYSPTFMAKFGQSPSKKKEEDSKEIDKNKDLEITDTDTNIKHIIKEEEEKNDVPVSLDTVKSELYILEDFNDEEEIETMEHVSTGPSDSTGCDNQTKVIRNLAEDVMKARAPEVMKSFNMCTCQDCVYDVMAFALNHTKPLYTVTEKGQLFQKLASYELQYGTDLTSALTKACIRVKINPNHDNHHKPNQR